MLCGISPPFEGLSPASGQVVHVLLTRLPLYSQTEVRFLVRLACVRHAASVHSEPGSNSPVKFGIRRFDKLTAGSLTKTRKSVNDPAYTRPLYCFRYPMDSSRKTGTFYLVFKEHRTGVQRQTPIPRPPPRSGLGRARAERGNHSQVCFRAQGAGTEPRTRPAPGAPHPGQVLNSKDLDGSNPAPRKPRSIAREVLSSQSEAGCPSFSPASTPPYVTVMSTLRSAMTCCRSSLNRARIR